MKLKLIINELSNFVWILNGKRIMKKKTFAILIVAVFLGYNVYQSQKGGMMSDLMLANVEALARYEINPDCPNGCTSASSYCYCFKIYTNMREVHWQ